MAQAGDAEGLQGLQVSKMSLMLFVEGEEEQFLGGSQECFPMTREISKASLALGSAALPFGSSQLVQRL